MTARLAPGVEHGRAGRPSKRTLATEATLLRTLRLGHPVDTCARLAGLAPDTFRAWRAEDPKFSAECERARAQAQGKLHGTTWKGALKSPPLALELLSRLWPADYARKDSAKIQLEAEVKVTATIDPMRLSLDELADLRRLVLKAQGGLQGATHDGATQPAIDVKSSEGT